MASVRNFAIDGLNALLRNDARLDPQTFKYGLAAIRLDGAAGSYVQSGEVFALGALDWCFEAWVNVDAAQPNAVVRLAQLSTALSDQYGPGHLSLRASGGLAVIAHDFDPATPLISTSEDVIGAGWVHLALSREGSTWRLFRDGVIVGTATWAGTITGTNPWFLGGHPYTDTAPSGWIDDARLTVGAARYTTAFTPPADELPTTAVGSGDPNFSSVSLLLDMNGTNGSTTFTDASASPMTVGISGGASVSTASSRFGGASLYLDGSEDWLSITSGLDALKFGTGDFTIELWLQTQDSNCVLIDAFGGSNGYQLWMDASGRPGFFIGSSQIINSGLNISDNAWHHVAVSRESGTVRLFVDGVSLGTPAANSTSLDFSATTFAIGAQVSSRNATYDYQGYIDDVRITKGVARYTANFTPPTEPFPTSVGGGGDPEFANVSLLLSMDETFADQSLNELTITVNDNAQISTAQSRFGGASGLFDGSGDYLTISQNAILEFGTGDFTVEAFCRFNTTGDMGLLGSSGVGGYDFAFIGSEIRIGRINIAWDQSAPFVRSTGVWYHVAWCRNNTTIKIFVDGVEVGSQTNTNIYNAITAAVIGGSTTTDRTFNGYIDDVRITKGVARYTENFTPPTEPFPRAASGAGGDSLFSNVELLLTANAYTSPIGVVARRPDRLATFGPDWPVKYKVGRRTANLNRITFGGKGRINGTVKVSGTPNEPVRRRVRLFEERGGVFVADTFSDATTGAYEFIGLDETLRFTVISYDYTGNYRSVIADGVIPEIVL